MLLENQWVSLAGVLGVTAGQLELGGLLHRIDVASEQLRQQLRLRSAPLETREVDGEVLIRASGIAGTVGVGRYALDVAPKFVRSDKGAEDWNSSTLFLLRAVRRRHFAYRRSERMALSRLGFVDHVALAYLDACAVGLADQPIQTYRSVKETLPVLRGRLDIQRQLRVLGRRPHVIECEVNRLDTENEYNALLKWAAVALTKRIHAPAIRRAMLELVGKLPGVPDRRLAMRGGRLFAPPQYRSWSEALDLAVLLASGLTHSSGNGTSSGYAFAFNMERLFEEFVEGAVSRALRTMESDDLVALAQVTTEYAQPVQMTESKFYSRPDNVIRCAGVPLAIVDAKYKRLSEATDTSSLRKPNNADVYELVAAMTAQSCQTGLLVYPRINGDTELPDDLLRTWNVNAFGTDLTVGAVAIDLSQLRSSRDLDDVDRHLAAILTEMLPGL